MEVEKHQRKMNAPANQTEQDEAIQRLTQAGEVDAEFATLDKEHLNAALRPLAEKIARLTDG